MDVWFPRYSFQRLSRLQIMYVSPLRQGVWPSRSLEVGLMVDQSVGASVMILDTVGALPLAPHSSVCECLLARLQAVWGCEPPASPSPPAAPLAAGVPLGGCGLLHGPPMSEVGRFERALNFWQARHSLCPLRLGVGLFFVVRTNLSFREIVFGRW